MCELKVYQVSNGKREKVMESVIRLTQRDGRVLLEGIFGESKEVSGTITDVDIMAQEALVFAD